MRISVEPVVIIDPNEKAGAVETPIRSS